MTKKLKRPSDEVNGSPARSKSPKPTESPRLGSKGDRYAHEKSPKRARTDKNGGTPSKKSTLFSGVSHDDIPTQNIEAHLVSGTNGTNGVLDNVEDDNRNGLINDNGEKSKSDHEKAKRDEKPFKSPKKQLNGTTSQSPKKAKKQKTDKSVKSSLTDDLSSLFSSSERLLPGDLRNMMAESYKSSTP